MVNARIQSGNTEAQSITSSIAANGAAMPNRIQLLTIHPAAMSDQPRDGGSEKGDCPACEHPISRVVDSRGTDRIRECVHCRSRWRTREIVVGPAKTPISSLPASA